MNTIRSMSQPIVAFAIEHVWRPLNVLQTKTKWVALALFGGFSAYLVCRVCLKGLKVVSHSLDKMKVCYQGEDFFFGEKKEKDFKEALGKFKIYRTNPSNQKDEKDQPNPAVICLSHDFANENNLGPDCVHLKMFVRYLVLEGVGVAYTQNGGGFYLYANQAAIPHDSARVYTKERLLDIHQKLEALPFPSLDNYPAEEKPIVEEILSRVKEIYYRRFDANTQEACSSTINLNTSPLASQVMDKLVSQCPDLIYAWNAIKYTSDKVIVVLQIKKGDFISNIHADTQWSAWRDKDIVAVESEIKEDERLGVDRTELSARYLAYAERLQVIRFIEELKTRTSGNKEGVWFADEDPMEWVLYHLKARGDIYNFCLDVENFGSRRRAFYRIAVNKEDCFK